MTNLTIEEMNGLKEVMEAQKERRAKLKAERDQEMKDLKAIYEAQRARRK